MSDQRPSGLDLLQRMIAGEIPPPPVAKLIGLELLEADEGRALFRLRAEDRHKNPMGTIHGGVLCDLADAAMGCAFATTIAPGQTYTTLELSINFLKPFWTGTEVRSASPPLLGPRQTS